MGLRSGMGWWGLGQGLRGGGGLGVAGVYGIVGVRGSRVVGV